MNHRVAVVGATTWGTTLGMVMARQKVPVTLLVRSAAEAHELESHREHRRFLPGVCFPKALQVEHNPVNALPAARLVILAVPSHRMRENLRSIRKQIAPGTIVLSAAKGLEIPNGLRMSQVMAEELPATLHRGICVLSGPNLAREIVQGKPASTVVASRDAAAAETAQAILMSPNFRVYTSDDVVGVELAGALKNIIALGAGIGDGLEMGDNAKAAFITRGLAEITRLGLAAGAQPLTFAGLAGLGDLIATCASPLSRNHYVGEQLARGRTWLEIRATMDNVAEGVNTTIAALKLAKELAVEMPIAQAAHRVLFEGLSPQDAIAELMGRPPRSEW
ncbi:MAG: NAD(P)-dependent glycerol-3-phosphate dehydrogenase [SAR202 cluster bacterium]|nr:NAD(P)-dependent glycerol-3-phosphate dehydrogenase [SAR202 cluster bacterium]